MSTRLLGLRDLSYRLKVPLILSIVIVATAIVVSAVLGVQTYRDLRRDLIGSAESLAVTLSRALVPVVLRDDVWKAYETIVAPLDLAQDGGSGERTVTILDAQGAIYASSHPLRFPMLGRIEHADERLASLLPVLLAAAARPVALEDSAGEQIVVAAPILADDGTRLGTVMLTYPESLFLPRFYATVRQVVLSTLVVLALLVPIGWAIGDRIVEPLARLARAMTQVGARPAAEVVRPLYRSGDEIGQLGQQFARMLHELEAKQALEKEMIAADRLAALGRLTAGIAHEINNPLGGMMNAVSTFRRHAHADPVAARTVSLLERGLQQIRETVGALLVEARLESHALTREDLEDVRLLVHPEAEERSVQLEWRNDAPATLPLPSTQVRQILINLLLNAVHAAAERGRIACRVATADSTLLLDVRNDGKPIPPELADRLFEPFASGDTRGSGLGLWVTYQIVQQLGGRIAVRSAAPETAFTVSLPYAPAS
jgi:two-component system NtrC family sensor kinase